MGEDERPASVPAGAEWNPGDAEWELAPTNDDGDKHGVVRWWRPDGTACCETEYLAGTAHGAFRRFHENGEPSREGRFVEGALHGTNTFFRSTESTTEHFPPGLGPTVWSAQMDYERGRVVEARAYDRSGARVLEDGSPFPTERPTPVPESATFRRREADRQWRWVDGQVVDRMDGTIGRVGVWRFWTPEGILVASESYVDGKLDGPSSTFDPETGALAELVEWRAGSKHGRAEKRDATGHVVSWAEHADGQATGAFERDVEPDRYADPRVVREQGTQVKGDPTSLVLLDADGRELRRVTLARKADQDRIREVIGADALGSQAIAALGADQHLSVAFLAAVLAGQDPIALRARLASFQPPLTPEARDHQTHLAKMVASNVVRFGGGAVPVLSSLLDGIGNGGDAAELLRQAAATLDDHDESALAAKLVDAAVALDPEQTGHEYTRALIRMSLGDPEGARASIARLAGPYETARAAMIAYCGAVFSDLTGWVDQDPRLALARDVAPLLGTQARATAPPLELLQRAVRQGATRVAYARDRLQALFGDQPWLPPDLSALIPGGPEDVPLPEQRGIGLMHAARRDLLRLRWLCWTMGLDAVELPTGAEPAPSRPSRALSWAVLARTMQLESGGVDLAGWLSHAAEDDDAKARIQALLAERVPASPWFGLALEDCDRAQRQFAYDDEVGLFTMLLRWWGAPEGRTFFDPAPADEE